MSKNYNQSEIAYLKENVGVKRIGVLAENLNRPENSIIIKLKRLGIGNTKDALGLLTTGELASLLQVDEGTVRHWIKCCGLRTHIRTTSRMRSFHFIEPTEFWEWAFQNQNRIDFSKIERRSILPEPEWVEPIRSTKREVRYKNWTIKEIEMMVDLIHNGTSIKKVAAILDRSEISVQRKYKRHIEKQKMDC